MVNNKPIPQPLPVYTLAEYSKTKTSLFEIEELHANKVIVNPDYLIPRRRDYYLFVYAKSSGYRYWIDFKQYETQPNTFYCIVPRQVYVKEQYAALDAIVVTFTDAFILDEIGVSSKELPILQNLHDQHALVLAPDDIVFLDDLLGKMLTEFGRKQEWQTDILRSYLRILLIYLSRLYQERYESNEQFLKQNSLLQRFKNLLSQNYTTIHTVAGYASLLSVTPNHLNETIKKVSGQSANQWIQQRLALEARRLLFHTDLSVKEVAYELGFNEAAYFNRFFKRNTALTPQSFRTTNALKRSTQGDSHKMYSQSHK